MPRLHPDTGILAVVAELVLHRGYEDAASNRQNHTARGNVIPDTNKLLSQHGILRIAESEDE